MSAETVGGVAAIKWLWSAIFAPFLWWLANKVDKLEEKSYSKSETDKQIDLKLGPMQKTLDDNTAIQRELSAAITDLRIINAKLIAELRNKKG